MAKQKNNTVKVARSGKNKAPSVLGEVRHLGVLVEKLGVKIDAVDHRVEEEVRHLGVKVEAVDHKVQLIAEQLDSHTKRFEGIEHTLDSHTEMIGNLATDMAIVKDTVESHSKMLESHSKMLESHSTELAIIKETVSSHSTELAIIKETVSSHSTELAIIKEDAEFIKSSMKKKIDVEEFAALERRVALLEKHG